MTTNLKPALLLAALALAGCKKNEAAESLQKSNAPTHYMPPVYDTEESLKKEAQSKPLTNVAFSEVDFAFGKIKRGEKVMHTYEVTNTGTNPLIISNVRPGCGCTVPEYTKEPILPGKKGQITLKFDSSSFQGLVNKQAQVYANVAKAPVTLTFTADIK